MPAISKEKLITLQTTVQLFLHLVFKRETSIRRGLPRLFRVGLPGFGYIILVQFRDVAKHPVGAVLGTLII